MPLFTVTELFPSANIFPFMAPTTIDELSPKDLISPSTLPLISIDVFPSFEEMSPVKLPVTFTDVESVGNSLRVYISPMTFPVISTLALFRASIAIFWELVILPSTLTEAPSVEAIAVPFSLLLVIYPIISTLPLSEANRREQTYVGIHPVKK